MQNHRKIRRYLNDPIKSELFCPSLLKTTFHLWIKVKSTLFYITFKKNVLSNKIFVQETQLILQVTYTKLTYSRDTLFYLKVHFSQK